MNSAPIDGEIIDTAEPTRAIDLTIGAVMSRTLFTVAADESIALAWELLRRSGFRHLPVVDESGHCLGLVEALSLINASAHDSLIDPAPVRTLIADREVVRVSDRDTVQDAAHAMASHHVDGLAVVDDDDRLIGLITAWDLVECLAGRRQVNQESSTGPVLFRVEPVMPAKQAR